MKTIRIDGVDYEVGTEAFAQALQKYQAKMDSTIETLSKDLETKDAEMEKLQAKLDEAGESMKKKDAEIAELPKKLTEKISARSELEAKARKVLGAKAKLDSDDAKLRLAVIQKINPTFKADGKSEAYIEARFDAALETFDADEGSEQALSDARTTVDPAENTDTDTTEEVDADGAYKKMRNDNAAAWKRTLKRGGIEV